MADRSKMGKSAILLTTSKLNLEELYNSLRLENLSLIEHSGETEIRLHSETATVLIYEDLTIIADSDPDELKQYAQFFNQKMESSFSIELVRTEGVQALFMSICKEVARSLDFVVRMDTGELISSLDLKSDDK